MGKREIGPRETLYQIDVGFVVSEEGGGGEGGFAVSEEEDLEGHFFFFFSFFYLPFFVGFVLVLAFYRYDGCSRWGEVGWDGMGWRFELYVGYPSISRRHRAAWKVSL